MEHSAQAIKDALPGEGVRRGGGGGGAAGARGRGGGAAGGGRGSGAGVGHLSCSNMCREATPSSPAVKRIRGTNIQS